MRKGKKAFLLLFLLLLVAVGLYIYFSFFSMKSAVKVKQMDQIEGYGYTLNDRHPEIYKTYFKELKKELKSSSIEEENYVTLLSKLFIIDLYSLDIRIDSNDVGGIEFVYEPIRNSYKEKVQDTIYLHLESDLYGNRKQSLPIVKDVSVNQIKTVPYYYNGGKEVDNEAYEVTVSWDYERDLGYQENAKLYFIHEDNKLSLVEIK